MSQLNKEILPVISDARALAGVVLEGETLDRIVKEYEFPQELIGGVLFRHSSAYFAANCTAARLSPLEEVRALEPVTTYGRASVASVISGVLSHVTKEDIFTGSNRRACVETEPNFVRAIETAERLGLVFTKDGTVVAIQKKTGQEQTVLALEDFVLQSELNGSVKVPKASVFSIGKSATSSEMKVVDVGEIETHKAVVLRATTFSLPAGIVETSNHAPWFGLEKDERGLPVLQERIAKLIS